MEEFQEQLDELLDYLEVSKSTTKVDLWIKARASHDKETYIAFFALSNARSESDEDCWSDDCCWQMADAFTILGKQFPVRWQNIDQGKKDLRGIWDLLNNFYALEIVEQHKTFQWIKTRLIALYGEDLELLDKEEARDFVALSAIGKEYWRKPTTLQSKIRELKSPHDWELISFISEKLIERGVGG